MERKKIRVLFVNGKEVVFYGLLRDDGVGEDWCIFDYPDGTLLRCRKEHLVYILEES